ncbi:MAG: class I SAM-dependent methyltransferase, partial [Promethearchaeota archaeon]
EFFNTRAEDWDNIVTHIPEKVAYIVNLLEISPEARILDVGTGTGILIPYLSSKLSSKGEITAIDYSEGMITVASQKYPKTEYPRVSFLVQDAYEAPMTAQYDVIVCYSCFPHFPDKPKILAHFVQGLAPGGKFMIAHSDSRDGINNIHKDASDTVTEDNLPPMQEMIDMAEKVGLKIRNTIDSADYFILLAEVA